MTRDTEKVIGKVGLAAGAVLLVGGVGYGIARLTEQSTNSDKSAANQSPGTDNKNGKPGSNDNKDSSSTKTISRDLILQIVQETSPGLSSFTANPPLGTARAVVDYINIIKESIAQNPDLAEAYQAAYPVYNLLTGDPATVEFGYRPISTEQSTYKEMAEKHLGFTPTVLAQLPAMQDRLQAQFGDNTPLLRPTGEEKNLRNLPFAKDSTLDPNKDEGTKKIMVEENGHLYGFGQFDNAGGIYEISYAFVQDTFKHLTVKDGVTVWDALSPQQRRDLALKIAIQLVNQRITGSVNGEWRPMQFRDENGQLQNIGMVKAGDLATCDVRNAALSTNKNNSSSGANKRSLQQPMLQPVRIAAQNTNRPEDINSQAPFNEDSRNGIQAVALIVDKLTAEGTLSKFSAKDNKAIFNWLLKNLTDYAAYERIDESTTFNGDGSESNPDIINGIPDTYTIGGLTFSVRKLDEFSMVFISRICGTPVKTIVIPTPQSNTPPPEETPKPPEPKESCEDCDHKGETEPQPTRIPPAEATPAP
jgi:hypothetical protein